jgi:uncharacterized protein (TIGR03083 family)
VTATGIDKLRQRVETGWQAFDARVDLLAPGDLDRVTTSGWTIGAMLGHVAAWHDATAYRLDRFAATGHEQPPVEADEDRFNARVAAEVEGLPAARLVEWVRASHDRLDRALRALPALDADGWVEAVVAGNTFEHYEEHTPELEGLPSR